jgi:hypothetical protein
LVSFLLLFEKLVNSFKYDITNLMSAQLFSLS